MELRRTSVIMIYDDFWILGSMPTKERRVLDVLKDASSDYVQICNVQMFRNETRLHSLSQGVIAKQKVSLILIPDKEHEAPQKRSLMMMKKKACEACVLVPGYTIKGTLHPTRIDNSLLTLTGGVSDFFPVTNATVSGAGIEPLQVPVAIINKSVVAFFSVDELSGGRSSVRSNQQQKPRAVSLLQDGLEFGLKEAANSLLSAQDPVHLGERPPSTTVRTNY